MSTPGNKRQGVSANGLSESQVHHNKNTVALNRPNILLSRSRGHTPFANSVQSANSAAHMLHNPFGAGHNAAKSQLYSGIKSSKGSCGM